jgi:hypothetical protein
MKKIKGKMNRANYYMLALLAFIFFVGIDQFSRLYWLEHLLQNTPRNTFKNVFLINYTFMGDGIFAAGLMAVLYFYWKERACATHMFISFFLDFSFVQIIFPRFSY